ncbi:large subunit ribosomal protein L28e [Strigomonas culicis]|uniref:Large subunit ribosomal protein L28e n=2 Tax=Strigomonas culicis TaxID=28005 RepID=S9TZH5_9TRYP|nr:large subunit ribosomal protein L28e [Strigomonas culicis]|eukprot:EPY23947.1 large subunit ribosomal protein L28e [Strigomonas culicis]
MGKVRSTNSNNCFLFLPVTVISQFSFPFSPFLLCPLLSLSFALLEQVLFHNMTHSADLQWQLTRLNSKYLQKRGGYRLSSDPFNNNGNWTKRQSGFLNDTAVVVKPGKQGALVLTVKDGKNNNKPKQTYAKKPVADAKAAHVAAGAVRADQTIVVARRAKRLAAVHERELKVRAARKARSANIKFARKAVRPKRK